MNKNLLLVLLANAVLLGSPSCSQADWLSDIKIRKTAQTGSDDLSKPATLNYTRPAGEHSSYAADIAFLKILKKFEEGAGQSHRSWETSAFLETHKNTLASKKQDTSFLGLNLAGLYGLVPHYPLWIPRASIAYSQDKVKDTKSILFQSDLTWLDSRYAVNQEAFVGSISFIWSPVFGAEHQRALDVPADTDRGSVSRLYAALDLKFTPVKMLDRISLTLSGKAWREANRSGLYDQGSRSRRFQSMSLDWELVPKERAMVGLSREVGENPAEGLPKSAVTKLAFKFKFN